MHHSSGSAEETASVSFHIPCQLKYLVLIRESTLEICTRMGMPEFRAYQLEMAVDEACANAIEHSYGITEDAEPAEGAEGADAGLQITFLEQPGRIVVEIIDQGAGFEFHDHPTKTPDECVAAEQERGLGMFIIGSFVDDVTYERQTPRGNVLRLTKAL